MPAIGPCPVLEHGRHRLIHRSDQNAKAHTDDQTDMSTVTPRGQDAELENLNWLDRRQEWPQSSLQPQTSAHVAVFFVTIAPSRIVAERGRDVLSRLRQFRYEIVFTI